MASIGGLAGGFAFDPLALRWLIVLTPAGFFLAARSAPTPLKAFLRVLLGAYLHFGAAICWLYTTGRYNGFAYVGVTLLPLAMACFPAAVAWLARRNFDSLGLLPGFAAFGALWLVAEWLRTLGRLSFPWALLGHAWAPWPAVIQTAEFGGELAVSLTVLLFSAALVAALRFLAALIPSGARPRIMAWLRLVEVNGSPSARRLLIAAVALVAAASAVVGFSAARGRNWTLRLDRTDPADRLRVAILQPNIAQDLKMAAYSDPDPEVRRRLTSEINRVHVELIRDRVPPGIDLLVMPESTVQAIVLQFGQDPPPELEALTAELAADCIIGAMRPLYADPEPGGTRAALKAMYNSAFFIASGGRPEAGLVQDKIRLVPFGEYLPYFDLIPFFNDTFTGLSSFTEGRKTTLFQTRGRSHGTLICFESAYSSHGRRLATAGAEFLSVITNDAWYRRSAGPAQHHHLSILRAVETRRPVVRSANTGISSIIDPVGRLTASLALGERNVLVGEIAPQSVTTFFTRWGNRWLLAGAIGVLAAGFALQRRAAAPLTGES